MKRVASLWHRLPSFMRTYLFWVMLVGAVWVFFLQPYSLVNFWEMIHEKRRLEKQVADYQQGIDSLKSALGRLDDPAFVERIARLQYGMKKPGEKVFVLVDE